MKTAGWSETWPALVLAGAVALYGWLSVGSLRLKSPTVDEKIHLAAGLADLKTGDFRMDPEHPPLLKCWAALPLLFTGAVAPLDHIAWKNGDTVGFGRVFLYYANPDPEAVLYPARFAMVLLNGLLIPLVYFWTRRLWGSSASAAFAAVLMALCPNAIAHARLVTTDAGMALFSVLLLYALDRFSCNRWLTQGLLLGVTLGCALLSKYSALVWMPWIAGVLIARCDKQLRRWLPVELAVFGVAFVLVWIGYAGSPPWADYLHGFEGLRRRLASGHSAYLFGRVSKNGWYHYFLAVILFKTPLSSLLLWGAALVLLPRVKANRRALWAVAAPAAWFLAVASLSRHDIGVRHILPVYPLLYIFAAGLVSNRSRLNRRIRIAVGVVFSAGTVFTAIRAYPDYIPFFNVLAGGRDGGYRYLSDSNLDWGQDLKSLERYLREKPLPKPIYIDYFGDKDLVRKRLPQLIPVTPVEEYKPTSGTFAVSLFKLQNIWAPSDTRYAWLKLFEPLDVIGGSIRIYTPDIMNAAPESLRRMYRLERLGAPIDAAELPHYLRSGWKHVDVAGDWVFERNSRGDTLRAVDREPTLCVSFPAGCSKTGVQLTADFKYLSCAPEERQHVRVFCNDKAAGRIGFGGEWVKKSVVLPAEYLGDGVNIIRFEAEKYVFPRDVCPPDFRIGETGVRSPVPLFMRCGRSGRALYRDISVGGRRVDVPLDEGIFCAVLNPDGTVSGTFAARIGHSFPADVRRLDEWMTSLQNGTIVLYMEIRETRSGDGEKGTQTSQTEEELRVCRRRLGLSAEPPAAGPFYLVSVGITGAAQGSVIERWGDRPVFISLGRNGDDHPFSFGMKTLMFSRSDAAGIKTETERESYD